MRLRAGSRWLFPLTVAVAALVTPLLSAGCGGGSSSAPTTPTPTPIFTATPTPTPTPGSPVTVRSTINWGTRITRQQANEVSGPSSAVSATIALLNTANNSQVVLTQTVNRTPDVELGGRKTYSSDQQVPSGNYTVSVRFYSDYDGKGTIVGTAGANTSVLPDGTLAATFGTVGTIQNITIPAGQVVRVGETKVVGNQGGAGTLLYEPRDNQGNIIALPTSDTASTAATVQLIKADSIDPSQQSASAQGASVTGLAPNRATIRIRLDNATSADTEIVIRSNAVITVTPSAPVVSIESSLQFLATVQNDGPAGAPSGVTWSLKEGATFGSISATGLFVSNRNEGTYTIVARSNYDPDIVVETPVIVRSLVTVTVNPNPVSPISFKGGQIQFTASVSNVPDGKDAGVTWKVETPNGGSITPNDGLYTAPATVGDYVIVATSNYDTSKFTRVTVPVRSLIVVTAPETTATLSVNQSRQFSASVAGVPPGGDTSVTWSAPDGGSVTPDGVYTAPASVPNDQKVFRVLATSKFDPAAAPAVINVTVQSGSGNFTIQ